MDYINATPEEKEAWIQDFINKRLEEGYNSQREGMGTNVGLMSVKSTLRYKARVRWNRNKNRQAQQQG